MARRGRSRSTSAGGAPAWPSWSSRAGSTTGFAAGAPRDRLVTAEQFRRNPVVGYTLGQALAEELLTRGGMPRLRELLDELADAAEDKTPPARAEAAALRTVYDLSGQELAAAGYARLLTINRP